MWEPTFFGHTKFEENFFRNSFIYRVLGCLCTNFFGHTKFEVIIFLEFFCLQCTVDSEFFKRGVWVPTFFGHAKFEI